ncbi:MAG: cytochrome c [Elusimicrobiota bacterium]|nr:MAG: cytochrome c [Elusimicrobiota bacterium]
MNAILPLILLLASAALAASAADAPAPKADPVAAVYKSKCASCHAKDGTGNPAMAKMFKVKPEAMNLVDEETLAAKDEDLAKVIETGKGKMPAFKKDKLKDITVADLTAYFRSLAPKKEAKP